MKAQSTNDVEPQETPPGDVSVMPLCECGRAVLSRYNEEGECNLCQLEEREAWFKTIRTIETTMPRYRIVRVLQESTRPLRSSQIAKMAAVNDNETYRILRDLVRREQVDSRKDGLATFYTYRRKQQYGSMPVNDWRKS